MFDTIVFRIHDLNKNEQLMKWCNLQATLNKSLVDHSTVEVRPDHMYNVIKLNMSAYQMSGKKSFHLNGHIKMTSSHYECAFGVFPAKNCIEFNFSIPKMVYGTNILQLVPHYNEKGFDQSFWKDYHNNFLNAFKRLKEFMNLFAKKLEGLAGQQIDLSDIEVRRLDVCYNQVFLTKRDALLYLEQQKRIKKKYNRHMPKNIKSFPYAVWVQTENYVAKIYHKGEEYGSVGDRGKHIKRNKEFGYEHYQINDVIDYDTGEIVQEGLQTFADRILRYEISFTSDYMSKIWKKFFFRKKSKRWQMLNKDYKEYHKAEQSGNIMSIPKDIQKNARIYNKLFNQTSEFYLRVDRDVEIYNDSEDTIEGTPQNPSLRKPAPLTRGLIEKMIKIFDAFFREFQLNAREGVSEVERQIDIINAANTKLRKTDYFDKEKTKRIRKRTLLQFISNTTTYTDSELIKRGLYSRQGIYLNRKKLQMLGFVFENTLEQYNLPVQNDFSEYHNCVTMQRVAVSNLLNSNTYFF